MSTWNVLVKRFVSTYNRYISPRVKPLKLYDRAKQKKINVLLENIQKRNEIFFLIFPVWTYCKFASRVVK